MRSRKLTLTLAVVAAAIVVPLGLSNPLSAAAKCQPSRPNDNNTYQDGWSSAYTSTTGGVRSDILNYSPWVWPQYLANGVTPNVAVAWTMATNLSYWAQTGWLEESGGARYTFDQLYGPVSGYTTPQTNLFNAYPTGQVTNYATLYYPPNGQFSMQATANHTNLQTPVALGFVPTYGQISSEMVTLSDQMPGAVQDPENFQNTYWYSDANGTYVPLNGSLFIIQPPSHNPPYPGFYYNKLSTSQYETSDAACTGT